MRSHFPSSIREWTFFREVWQQIIRKCWSFSIRCSMFDFYFFLLGALGQGLTQHSEAITMKQGRGWHRILERQSHLWRRHPAHIAEIKDSNTACRGIHDEGRGWHPARISGEAIPPMEMTPCSHRWVRITNHKSTNNIRTLPEGCAGKVARRAHSSMPNCRVKRSLLSSTLLKESQTKQRS